MINKRKTILQAVVGSIAQNLVTPTSDVDVRSIYIVPTADILSIGHYQKFIEAKAGEMDDFSWELGHFIDLALKCNPSVLEAFKCPILASTKEGRELINLFPYFLNRTKIYNAYLGFAISQKKKLLSPDTHEARKPKSAAHYLRLLWQGYTLLLTGSLVVDTGEYPEKLRQQIIDLKAGRGDREEAIRRGEILERALKGTSLSTRVSDNPNTEPINKWLLGIRRRYWDLKEGKDEIQADNGVLQRTQEIHRQVLSGKDS